MRILVYGMQSSGASLFTFFLAQRPDSIGIIDLWPRFLAPRLEDTDKDVVLKCVVTTAIPIEQHIRSFQPDVKILFVRAKQVNLESLVKKGYRDGGGTMSDKYAQLERDSQQTGLFDFVISYEEFLHDPATLISDLHGLAAPEYYDFRRTKYQILRFNRAHSVWCRRQYWRQWGFGNIQFEHDGTVRLNTAGAPLRRPDYLRRLYRSVRGRVATWR